MVYFPQGVEETLWKSWEWWLIQKRLASFSRTWRRCYLCMYINYPLSQALLRKGDKETLERLFREREKLGALKSCLGQRYRRVRGYEGSNSTQNISQS